MRSVTHAGTNRAWRSVTTFIDTNALALSQTGNTLITSAEAAADGHSYIMNVDNCADY